jgi:hypothetical protein
MKSSCLKIQQSFHDQKNILNIVKIPPQLESKILTLEESNLIN